MVLQNKASDEETHFTEKGSNEFMLMEFFGPNMFSIIMKELD